MKIADCMKRDVVSITASASIGQAAARFASRHIGMLPVVHAVGHLVGVLQLRDLLALVMPDFVQLVDDFDFVHDFGAVESQQPSPEMLARPVTEVMQPPISVEATCGLLRAFAMLREHDLHDLPVVDAAGRLVGIASRVDIGTALLANWRSGEVDAT
ncbi:MAG TPA: CBS domain-containing protein [Anaerolineae bacterium]|nr:CBS domain-containing protein [Anaerolineae bacterium]